MGFLSKEKQSRFTCATLHALLYRHYGCRSPRLLTPYLFKRAEDFDLHFGKRLTKREGVFDDWLDPETDDDLAYVEFQRLRSLGAGMSLCRYDGYVGHRVKHLFDIHAKAFNRGFWDFAYLLERGAVDTSFKLSADYVAIDEINDLNPLQVAIVARATGGQVDQVGDLSQCIYGWAGVDPSVVRQLPYDNVVSLETSYRLTPPVALAANAIIRKSKGQIDGTIRTLKAGGAYIYEPQIRNILSRIAKDPKPFGHVYILARSNYLKEQVERLCDDYGLNRAVDKDHERFGRFMSLMRNPPKVLRKNDLEAFVGPWIPSRTYLRYGAKTRLIEYNGPNITWDTFWNTYGTDLLREAFVKVDEGKFLWYAGGNRIFDTTKPLVHTDTIHKSKGMEDDTCIVLTDKPARVSLGGDREEEIRLAYVAVTRSKERTYVTCLDSSKQETAYQFTSKTVKDL